MPSSCCVNFNENPDGIYSSGQVISGRVNLVTDRIKAIRGVSITIRGYADVRWDEEESRTAAEGQNDTETITYSAHNDYFSSSTDVMTTNDGGRFDLKPGNYVFNFQMQLPHNLPSSFNGRNGEIRYEVVCTIDRPWRFNNVFRLPFNIVSPLDLNANPIYRQPSERSTIKYFDMICCCGDGGSILVKGNIPYSGFVPGQSIPVNVTIKNLSKIDYHEVKIKFIEVVEYQSCKPRPKSKYETIEHIMKKIGVPEKSVDQELFCNLTIPSVPPSSFSSCKIIEVSYYVEIQLKTKGLHTNMLARLPVTIGTVPVLCATMPSSHVVTSQPLSLQGGFNGNQFGSSLIAAPPSYEEATKHGPRYVNITDENRHEQNAEFIPKYPVYHYISEIVAAPPAYTPEVCEKNPPSL